MHKTKVVTGVTIVALALAFLSVIAYDYVVLDCADIGNTREMEERPCTRTPNFYIFSMLSLLMLVFGSWLLVFGIKGLSMISGKKEFKGMVS